MDQVLWDFFGVFQSPKQVQIQDYRLGITFRLVQALAILYTIFNLSTNKSYLIETTPRFVLTSWAEADSKALQKMVHNETLNAANKTSGTQCGDVERYSYKYSDTMPHSMFSFKGADSMTSFFFTTATTSSTRVRKAAKEGQKKQLIVALNDPTSNISKVMEELGEACKERLEEVDEQGVRLCDGDGYTFEYDPAELDFMLRYDKDGSCVCKKDSTTLTVGVEAVNLTLEHSASVYYKNNDEGWAGANSRTYNQVKTILRVSPNNGKERTVQTFNRGEKLTFSIGDLLDWLDVDLDKPMNEEENQQWVSDMEDSFKQSLTGKSSTEIYPRPRLTGMRVMMDVNYYNYDMAHMHHIDVKSDPPPPGKERDDMIVRLLRARSNLFDHDVTWCGFVDTNVSKVAVIVMKPYFAWTSRGDDFTASGRDEDVQFKDRMVNNYRYGIHVEVSVGGLASEFDWANVVSSCLDAIVLFSVGNTVVTFLARMGPLCPGVNKLYTEFLIERASAPSAYARYILQALTAKLVFDNLDKDARPANGRPEKAEKSGGGKLEPDELYSAIKAVFIDEEALKKKEAAAAESGSIMSSSSFSGALSQTRTKLSKTRKVEIYVPQWESGKFVIGTRKYTLPNLQLFGAAHKLVNQKDVLCLTDGMIRVALHIRNGRWNQISMDDMKKPYARPKKAESDHGEQTKSEPDLSLTLKDFIEMFAAPPCNFDHITTFTKLQYHQGWNDEDVPVDEQMIKAIAKHDPELKEQLESDGQSAPADGCPAGPRKEAWPAGQSKEEEIERV